MDKTDGLDKLFWDYLHTVTLAHDDQPNEPHRQVIFKEDLPEIIKAIRTGSYQEWCDCKQRISDYYTIFGEKYCNDCKKPTKDEKCK